MRLLGLFIGVLVILIGAIGLAAPGVLLSLGRSLVTPGGLYVIAALRIVLGLFFVLAAPVSRSPLVLRLLGVIVIIAGLTTPWLGIGRVRELLDWWESGGFLFMRLFMGLAIVLGGFLVSAFRSPAGAPRPAA
jgi:hypothetical protein